MRLRRHAAAMFAILGSMAAAPAAAAGWQLGAGSAGGPPSLTFSDGDKVVYRLECEPAHVAVSQFGVTRLLDLQTNKPVGDEPGSTMTPGASVMALATDKVEPNMVAASATPNAARGWDMTIRLAKDDPSFLSLPRADMVSLFTTGYTLGIEVGKSDRKLLAEFVKQCRTR